MVNVRKAKFSRPTPVQKYALPAVMAGRDLMACAQTGSGKTAAFLLPVMTRMLNEGLEEAAFNEVQSPKCIIITPTRELAKQIYEDAYKFSRGTKIVAIEMYGGTSLRHNLSQLENGCHIIVATPGRLKDVVTRQKVDLSDVRHLILDEGDRMLDMGFAPAINFIVQENNMKTSEDGRQTLMFSATFAKEVQELARKYLIDHLFLAVGIVGGTSSDITQKLLQVDDREKRDTLVDMLSKSGQDRTMVFVETKRNADFLASFLCQQGFPTTSIHGDRLQQEREEALRDFKKGSSPIIVCTSVAARSLDIPGVKHVINYDTCQRKVTTMCTVLDELGALVILDWPHPSTFLARTMALLGVLSRLFPRPSRKFRIG